MKEKLKPEFFLWFVICLTGGFLISYHDLFKDGQTVRSLFEFNDNKMGYILTLFAVFGWGSSTVFGKKLTLQGFSTFEIMYGRFFLGLVALIPLALYQLKLINYHLSDVSQIFAMVLLSGLFGMWFYYKGLQKIPARLCTLLELSFPFCAVIVNWIFLGQKLELIQIAGGCILLFGSLMLQMRRI